MTNERYLVISSDTHAGLPSAQYRDYLEPQYREAFDDDAVMAGKTVDPSVTQSYGCGVKY